MKLKILRIYKENKEGKNIIKPSNLEIDITELEQYRKSLLAEGFNVVLFTFEELEND